MLRTSRALRALCVLPVVLVTSGFRWIGDSDPVSVSAVANATTWLRSQQLDDGSFETAGFPGFETPDAILAIAERAQTKKGWNQKAALQAVQATVTNGHSPLHAIDDLVDAGVNAGQAAKIVVLVTKPLGLSANKFDPDHDGAVDLKRTILTGQQPDGSFGSAGTLNATLYAAIALRKLGRPVPPATVAFIRAARESGGGWNYAGDATGDYADADTTSLAVQALVVAGAGAGDNDVRAGLAWLARGYSPTTGAWQSFGADDANSTAVALLAITAAGFNPNSSCWRDTVEPSLTGQPYASPTGWLRSQQQSDGRIASANDAYGINTFATSQTIQALRRGWLPISPASKRTC